MAEATAKKRGRKAGTKVENKVAGLPTTGSIISPSLYKMLQACERTYDMRDLKIKFKDKYSAPVIKNLLKNGYCTNTALYNDVAKFFMERSKAETALAIEMKTAEVAAIEAFTELHEFTIPGLKERLKKIS